MSRLIPVNRNNSLFRPRGFEDFYNMLDDFFSDMPSRSLLGSDAFRLDVREDQNQYFVDAELPGVKKEDIKLELKEGVLSIAVAREENIEEKRDNYVHRERRYGSMHRSVLLPDAKPQGVAAKFENGLLQITVQKEEHRDNSYRIDIQ